MNCHVFVTLEEFPMAFFEEGGITTIPKGMIGTTSLLPSVQRSTTFRCINEKENKISGARIFGMVKKRKVEVGDHFFFEVINYDNIEYCNPATKCENDGHQFLGLRPLAIDDLKIADKVKRAQSGSKTPPKGTGGAAGTVPQTPAGKMLPSRPPTPQAPKKQPASRQETLEWQKKISELVWNKDLNSIDDWSEEDEDKGDDTKLYPQPPVALNKLAPKTGEEFWQYYPFEGKNGIASATKAQGGHSINIFQEEKAEADDNELADKLQKIL